MNTSIQTAKSIKRKCAEVYELADDDFYQPKTQGVTAKGLPKPTLKLKIMFMYESKSI